MDVRICVPPKPGHDVRDWINDMRSQGATRGEIFAEMEANCKPAGEFVAARREQDKEKSSDREKELDDKGDEILKALNLEVIGETEDCKILVYCTETRKFTPIFDVSRLRMEKLIQITPAAEDRVTTEPSPSSNQYSLLDVRKKIGRAGAKSRRLADFTLLGAGAWREKNEVILVGDSYLSAWSGGSLSQSVHPRRGEKIYNFAGNPNWFDHSNLHGAISQNRDKESIDHAIGIFERWRFQFGFGADLIVGLILATWVQTIWNWRPQIVVTGEAGTGKSMLFQALDMVFCGLALKSSDSTAAGLVQAVGQSARIILLDEFDSNKEREVIIQMVRRAGRGDRRLTGTSGQKSIETSTRQIYWAAGIESGLEKDTDTARFVQVELWPKESASARLELPSREECEHVGQCLLAASVRHGMNSIGLAAELSNIEIEGVSNRIVETYSVPAAIFALAHDRDPSAALHCFVRNHTEFHLRDSQSDSEALVNAILGAHVDAGRDLGRRSVEQLLKSVREGYSEKADAEIALEKSGVMYDSKEKSILLNQTNIIRHILRGTEWQKKNITEIICRVKGVEKVRNKRKRYVRVPENVFFDDEG